MLKTTDVYTKRSNHYQYYYEVSVLPLHYHVLQLMEQRIFVQC